MSREIKQLMIGAIEGRLSASQDVIFCNLSAIDARSMSEIRMQLESSGVSLLNVKNSLARNYFSQRGISSVALKGPSTFVFSTATDSDIVSLSKIVTEYTVKYTLITVKGGVSGADSLSPSDIEALSKCPSREQIISGISGTLTAMGAQVHRCLLSQGSRLASQISTHCDGLKISDASQV